MSAADERADDVPPSSAGYYEQPGVDDLYCEFHYGTPPFGLPSLHAACVDLALPHVERRERAVDVGCAVGRGCFELARSFDRVDGVDLSPALIARAEQIRSEGTVTWRTPVDGHLQQVGRCDLDTVAPDGAAERVRFAVGDAARVDAEGSTYDLVVACNLIDRVPDPVAVLGALARASAVGGCLLIASPFTWLAEFTPPQRWLGSGGEQPQPSFERLGAELGDRFELVAGPVELEFAIRETARKHQHTFAQTGVWRRLR